MIHAVKHANGYTEYFMYVYMHVTRKELGKLRNIHSNKFIHHPISLSLSIQNLVNENSSHGKT